MKNKEVIKLINEEISNFDFLGNDKYLKEEENLDLLKNEDFQKQFICDTLLKRKERIKTTDVVESTFADNWERNGYMTINYIIEFEYLYDTSKEPAKIGLHMHGDRISYSLDGTNVKGDRWTAPRDEAWFDMINWDDIAVDMFTVDGGDDIDFIAFNKAPKRIQHLFLRDFLGDFISDNSSKSMETPADLDDVNKVGYC